MGCTRASLLCSPSETRRVSEDVPRNLRFLVSRKSKISDESAGTEFLRDANEALRVSSTLSSPVHPCNTARPRPRTDTLMSLLSLYVVRGSIQNRRARSRGPRRETHRQRRSRLRPETVARRGRKGRSCVRPWLRRVGHELQLQVSAQSDRRTRRPVSMDCRQVSTVRANRSSSASVGLSRYL